MRGASVTGSAMLEQWRDEPVGGARIGGRASLDAGRQTLIGTDISTRPAAMGVADSTGAGVPPSLFDSQESLRFIGDQTGGLAVENTNDLNLGISRILEDQQGYYLLGTRRRKTRPRRLGSEPRQGAGETAGLRVRARQGFFGPFDTTRPENRGCRSAGHVGAFAVRLRPHHGAAHVGLRPRRECPEGGSYVRSLLFIDPAASISPSIRTGSTPPDFRCCSMAIGDNGQVLDGWRREVPLALTDGRSSDPGARPGRDRQERGKGSRARTRCAPPSRILSSNGAVDRRRNFSQVPDGRAGRLALSGVLLKGMTDGDSTSPGSRRVRTQRRRTCRRRLARARGAHALTRRRMRCTPTRFTMG